jgi:hypothetical protein
VHPDGSAAKFPEIKLATELAKELLIHQLVASSSFATTHQVVAKLGSHTDFTAVQANEIAVAAITNNQISWIATDPDVEAFLRKVIEAHQTGKGPKFTRIEMRDTRIIDHGASVALVTALRPFVGALDAVEMAAPAFLAEKDHLGARFEVDDPTVVAGDAVHVFVDHEPPTALVDLALVEAALGRVVEEPSDVLSIGKASQAAAGRRVPENGGMDVVVVAGVDGFAGDLRGIERPLQFGYSITSVDGQTPQFNVLQPLGTLQYDYYQPLANVAVDIGHNLTAKAGWNYYQYGEGSFVGPTLPRYFHANNAMFSLRWAF